mmetsp:Transcript_39394/g.125239  ORF Transcript_39394/g.125239 Transcript_39394/m.125239 type:complete len:207 (+) Transcript_39394:308-928(+)
MAAARTAKWQRATPLSKAELTTGRAPCLWAQRASSSVCSRPWSAGLRMRAAMGALQPSRSSGRTAPSVRLSSAARRTRRCVRSASCSQAPRKLPASCVHLTGSSRYSVMATAESERPLTKATASSTVHAWLASSRSRACGPLWNCRSSASLFVRRASSAGSLPTFTFTTVAPPDDSLRSSSRATSAFTPMAELQLKPRAAAAAAPR